MADALINLLLILRRYIFVTEKLSSIGFTFFGFAQSKIHDFQNSVLKCINATKETQKIIIIAIVLLYS